MSTALLEQKTLLELITKAQIPSALDVTIKRLNKNIEDLQSKAKSDEELKALELLKKNRQKVYNKRHALRVFIDTLKEGVLCPSEAPITDVFRWSKDDLKTVPLTENREILNQEGSLYTELEPGQDSINNNIIQNVLLAEQNHQDSSCAFNTLIDHHSKDQIGVSALPLEDKNKQSRGHIPVSMSKSLLLPLVILLLMLLAGSGYFCWLNSKQLFADHGVGSADLNTFWFIVVGCMFAMFNATGKGKSRHIYTLLCVFMASFEAWFLINGTISVETDLLEKKLEEKIETKLAESHELKFTMSLLEQAKQNLTLVQEKYQTPSSKLYKNDWYRTKFVNPAQKDVNELEAKLVQKKHEITKIESMRAPYTNNVSAYFKVGMRLFFAIACFLLVHKITRFIVGNALFE